MKAKILIALAVLVLFGVSSMIVYSAREKSGAGEVQPVSSIRICPTSGLPCDGDGLCSSGSGDLCGGCDSHTAPAAAETTHDGSDCDTCPSKAAGTCPGKTDADAQ